MSPADLGSRWLSVGSRFSWVDPLLPRAIREGDPFQRSRARLVLFALAPFFLAAVPVSAEYYLGGSGLGAAAIVVAVLAASLSPLVMRLGVAASVHYEMGLFVALMAVLAWVSGGLGSPPLYAYVLIPILGVSLVGWRGACAWSALVCLILVFFLGLELTGRTPPSGVDPAALARGHGVLPLLGIGVALAFTLLQDTHRRRVLADLDGARKQAEAANRAKGTFLANVGHELRTPMTGVLGMASLLQRSGIGPEQRDMVSLIERSAGSLLTLLDDILDYAQLESGRLGVEERPFEVRPLVRETIALVTPLALRKHLELVDYTHPDVPPRLVGDARRIRQILLNLLGNAIKFTETGQVRLDVRLEPEPGPPRVVIRVRDTGCGIPEEDRSRIFERFERVQAADGEPVPGSGLGLAICRGLLELIGAEMELESELGVGSCFSVRLPLVIPPDRPEPAVEPGAGSDLPGSLRVLLVEDNPVGQLVVRRMLEALGCRVTVADDGVAALARVREEAFDAVLMDCQMPRLDGLATTREIRGASETAALPVIGLTASLTAEEREHCLAAGMDEALGKPCSIEDLRAALVRHCAPPKEAGSNA